MTRVVTALYEQTDQATRVLQDLREAGFDDTQLESLEPADDADANGIRLWGRGRDAEVLDDDSALQMMIHLGIPEQDARHYLVEIAAGRSLVAVRAEEEISGRARQIINSYPLAESLEQTTLQPGVRTYPHPNPEQLRRADRPARADRDYPRTDIVEVDEASGGETTDEPRSENVESTIHHTRDETHDDRTAIGELSGRVAEERFKLFRPRFVRHYTRHYAAITPHDFETYARAYRYGMALATSSEHHHASWDDIKPRVRDQWERRMGQPFRQFREAIRFGWYVVRGEQEQYGRPPL